MNQEIDLVGLGELSAEQLQALTVAQLNEIFVWVKRAKSDIRTYEMALHQELVTRYKTLAAQIRTAHGKEAGTVRFTDGGYTIVADLPKRVEYDQKKLKVAVDELRAQGKDPLNYVAFEISITESAWNSYTPDLRELFQDARTVKTGKPTFELIRLAPGAIPDQSNDDSFRST
jgi:hypothetical protein